VIAWIPRSYGLIRGSRRLRLGFLGASPVCRKNPQYWLLDFLGFPWILSSESRLINGLHGINRAEVFVVLSPAVRSARTGAFGLRVPTGRIAHVASLIWFLIFCKGLLSDWIRRRSRRRVGGDRSHAQRTVTGLVAVVTRTRHQDAHRAWRRARPQGQTAADILVGLGRERAAKLPRR
jgi:hypothetical protein